MAVNVSAATASAIVPRLAESWPRTAVPIPYAPSVAMQVETIAASAFQTRNVLRGIRSAPDTQVGVTNTASRPHRR